MPRPSRTPHKFKAKAVTVQGISFDSKLEATRHGQLVLLQQAGAIRDLALKPVYELQPAFVTPQGKRIRAITYEADFSYFDPQRNRVVVEDCKGMVTEVAKLKLKMLAFTHGITVDIMTSAEVGPLTV